MTKQDLIDKYELELLFCDDRIKANVNHKEYQIAQNWALHKKAVR